MKYLLVICSLLVASASASQRFDDELREVAEYVKQQMPCGFPNLGVPPLEPYVKDFAEFDLIDRGLDFRGNLTGLTVKGLSDFEFTQLTYSIVDMKLRFDMNFNVVGVQSQYSARGGLNPLGLSVPLFGNGILGLYVENLRVSGSFRLRPTTSNGLQVWAFKVNLQADRVKSETTGVMNSQFFTNFFNAWVEEFFAILLQDYQDEVAAVIGDLVVPTANNFLKDLTMLELFVLVLGYGPNSENLPLCNVQ